MRNSGCPASIRAAAATTASPCLVRRGRRPDRSNSRRLSCASRRSIDWLTAACTRPSLRAAAEKLPGVKAVITAKDFPDQKFEYIGPERVAFNYWHMTRNIMAREKALYEGHSIAAVAAMSKSIADEAVSLIKVEYEVLPHAIDVDDAMKPDAPLLFDDMITRGIERGTVLLEINRERVESLADYRRIARAARTGDILTLYIYAPDLDQRQLKTIRVEDR